MTPTDTTNRPRSRPALYRTVLSLAVAALVAAWIPFSVFYVSALNTHSAPTAISAPATASAGARAGNRPVIITTASGATRVVPAGGAGAGAGGTVYAAAPSAIFNDN